MKAILAIDQGTTGTTSVLINAETMDFIGKFNQEYPQIYPKPGWVEHDLNDIWSSVRVATTEVLKACNVNPNDIVAIGITNQRETICPFRKSGDPIRNAIVWQDRRTEEFCKSFTAEKRNSVKMATGLPIDPYFSGTKIHWMLQNDHDVQEAYKAGDCLFGTIDTFLIYKLTQGEGFFTEPSNASRTLLFDIRSGDWSPELLEMLEVKREALPGIKNSFDQFGVTKSLGFFA